MTWEIFGQILLSLAIGGAIGLEREFRTGIGLRTMMLVSLGATLFTIYGEKFPIGDGDPRRITSSVVAAVGFLGAGMILSHRAGIFGFTTAATVWLVAALGVGVGIGEYAVALVAALLVLVVLWAIPFGRNLTRASQTMVYEAVGSGTDVRRDELIALMAEHGLKVTRHTMGKSEDGIQYVWQAVGRVHAHDSAQLALLQAPDVKEFHVVLLDELN